MRSFALCLLLLAVATLQAQTYSSPAKGSKDRTSILNALRAPVQKALKQKVEFKVDLLRVQANWAFVKGIPQAPGGGKVDYRKTEYQQMIKDGIFDNWICALLQKKNGKWTVKRYVIGATDVVYEPWPGEFGAPKAIFGLPT